MTGPRFTSLLVRAYPPAWRARYGEELTALILEMSGGGRGPWRIRADVVLAGIRERLRAARLGGARPPERVRGGALVVLWAWLLFVPAGSVVQKVSEHWQSATPAGSRALPAAAFDVLLATAALGSLLVVAGIAAAVPSLVACLRAGGWPALRRPLSAALVVTAAAIVATAGLVGWAQALTTAQRNGHDPRYELAFLVWAGIVGLMLATWGAAAVATARRLDLPAATLRFEAWVACLVTAAMGVMTVATAVWWSALADAAPGFFSGGGGGAAASASGPALPAAVAAMAVTTLIGGLGSARAVRALPGLSRPE